MIVMIQALHKVSKTNFSKALGCSFKKVTRLLVPLYTSGATPAAMWISPAPRSRNCAGTLAPSGNRPAASSTRRPSRGAHGTSGGHPHMCEAPALLREAPQLCGKASGPLAYVREAPVLLYCGSHRNCAGSTRGNFGGHPHMFGGVTRTSLHVVPRPTLAPAPIAYSIGTVRRE